MKIKNSKKKQQTKQITIERIPFPKSLNIVNDREFAARTNDALNIAKNSDYWIELWDFIILWSILDANSMIRKLKSIKSN